MATTLMPLDPAMSPQQSTRIPAISADATTWANATDHGFFVILHIAMRGEMPANTLGALNGATGGGGHRTASISTRRSVPIHSVHSHHVAVSGCHPHGGG